MDSTVDRSKTGFLPLPTESQVHSLGSYSQPGEPGGFTVKLNDFLLIVVTLALVWAAVDMYLGVQCDEFAPEGPVLDLGSSVSSNFTISDNRFEGTWHLGFIFKYNGIEDKAIVDKMEGRIGYDGVELANSKAKPFALQSKEQRTTRMTLVANKTGKAWDHLLKEMVKDRERGFLEFSLWVDVWISYEMWGKFRVGYLIPVRRTSCWDLVVRFSKETGDEELVGGVTRSCPLLSFG